MLSAFTSCLDDAGTPLADPTAKRLPVGRNSQRSPLLEMNFDVQFAFVCLLAGVSRLRLVSATDPHLWGGYVSVVLGAAPPPSAGARSVEQFKPLVAVDQFLPGLAPGGRAPRRDGSF